MVCQHVADWSRQVLGHIDALARRGGASPWLEGWRTRFAELGEEAEGMLNPWQGAMMAGPGVASLLERAYGALGAFVGELARIGEAAQGEEAAQAGRPSRRRQLNPVPPGQHQLPPLPYAYDALEPYIDEETMRLHHDKHHKAYVDGLNRAERMMAEARRTGEFDLIKHWEREAAFNGAGHYLHTLFWESMAPGAGGEPDGRVRAQIEQDFGGFDRFKEHFSKAAENVEGGGWAIWVWSPRANRTEILTAEKHQNLSQWDVVPLLPLDVWEHAYYLKYKNNRGDYISNWWNLVNWPAVAERLEQASGLIWQPM